MEKNKVNYPPSYAIQIPVGSSNGWTKRYKKMLEQYELLKTVETDPKIIRGFELCMNNFKVEKK